MFPSAFLWSMTTVVQTPKVCNPMVCTSTVEALEMLTHVLYVGFYGLGLNLGVPDMEDPTVLSPY